jgi:hypothetical protein
VSDFIDALEAEIADLERQLETSPIYVKLREARRLLAIYQPPQNTGEHRVRVALRQKGARGPRPASGNAAVVFDAVKGYLHGRVRPTPINEIMEMLKARGVEPGGTIPRNSVSSLLSRYKLVFVSHGRDGWTLAETEKAGDDAPEKDASPASVSTSAPVEPGEEVAHDNTLDVFR